MVHTQILKARCDLEKEIDIEWEEKYKTSQRRGTAQSLYEYETCNTAPVLSLICYALLGKLIRIDLNLFPCDIIGFCELYIVIALYIFCVSITFIVLSSLKIQTDVVPVAYFLFCFPCLRKYIRKKYGYKQCPKFYCLCFILGFLSFWV